MLWTSRPRMWECRTLSNDTAQVQMSHSDCGMARTEGWCRFGKPAQTARNPALKTPTAGFPGKARNPGPIRFEISLDAHQCGSAFSEEFLQLAKH